MGSVLEGSALDGSAPVARPVPRRPRRAWTGVAVSTIVVNHERQELLHSCLTSLQAAHERVGERTEIVVVDNGSNDGSVKLVGEQFPDVEIVALPGDRRVRGRARCRHRRSGRRLDRRV